jgi:hypothetical protein
VLLLLMCCCCCCCCRCGLVRPCTLTTCTPMPAPG